MIARADFILAAIAATALHLLVFLPLAETGQRTGGAAALGGHASAHSVSVATGASAAIVEEWLSPPTSVADVATPAEVEVLDAPPEIGPTDLEPAAPAGAESPEMLSRPSASQDQPMTPADSDPSPLTPIPPAPATLAPPPRAGHAPRRPTIDAATNMARAAAPTPPRPLAPQDASPPLEQRTDTPPIATPRPTRRSAPSSTAAADVAQGDASAGATSNAESVSGAQVASALKAWGAAINLAIAEAKRYPTRARRRGHEGAVTLRISVFNDGRLAAAAIAKGSGYMRLDEAALDAVADAAPFQTAPSEIGDGPHAFRLRVVFRMR